MSENKKVLDDCRRTYKEILLCHSFVRYNKKFCYIKHFRDLDLSLFQENTDEYIIEAQEQGLETESEKLVILCKGEHWSWENEDEIKNKQDVVVNVKIDYDAEKATNTDNMSDALNYKTVTKSIIALVEDNRFSLLEKLTAEVLNIAAEGNLCGSRSGQTARSAFRRVGIDYPRRASGLTFARQSLP